MCFLSSTSRNKLGDGELFALTPVCIEFLAMPSERLFSAMPSEVYSSISVYRGCFCA